MADTVCATRKSKAHPNVYTVKQLRVKAIADGHDSKLVNKLTKSNLCSLLNIEWIGKSISTKGKITKTKASDVLEINNWGYRECNVQKSKAHPNAFTKGELVKLAVKYLSLKNASNHTKQQLCALLNNANVKVPKTSTKTIEDKKKVDKKNAVKKSITKKKETKSTTNKKENKKEESKKVVKIQKVKKPKSTTPLSKAKKTPKKSTKKTSKTTPKKVKTLSKKDGEKGDCIERSKMKLKPHQIKLVEHLKTHRGIIAAFEVGSGKTLTAVAASQCYLDENPNNKVIIVTPKSLQENFKKELEAYGGDPNDSRYKFYTIRNFATTYAKGCPHNVFLIIDEVHNLRTSIKGDVGKGKTPKKTPTKVSRKDANKKGESIANAKVAVRCAKAVDKVLLLTATPLYNKPHDLINLAAMVKGTDPLMKAEFEKKSSKELCDYFKDTLMYFENPASDEYPDKIEHTIRVIMTPEFYKEYRNVELKKSHLWSAANPFSFLTIVRQATNAVDPCLKCEWAIRKIMEGQKTLVYSAFLTHGVKKLQSMLDELGIKYVEVTGSMSIAERKEAVKTYNSDKVKVMFITKAGGEGLDLKGTRNVILLEKSWNRPNEEQIIGRAVRFRSHTHLPKSEQHVDVYHLIIVKPAPEKRDKNDQKGGKNSADEMLDALTKEKEAQNTNFQNLLKSISIDAPAGTKCPPPNFKDIQFSKKKVKEDKYKITITEYKTPFHHLIPVGTDASNKAKIIKLINKPEDKIEFRQTPSLFEIEFTSKAKAPVPGLVRSVVSEIMTGTRYEAIRGKGSWSGAEKNEYKYTFEKRFK
jgi:superfamily II DNA or RNA helicase